jgi:hypothetical protein
VRLQGPLLDRISETRGNGLFFFSADSAGDLNGDGIDDLMASEFTPADTAGKVHFYDGANGAFLFSISPPSGGTFGGPVQRLSDMNGDGHDDWLIVGPGA